MRTPLKYPAIRQDGNRNTAPPYSGSAVFLFMVANDKLEFAGRARGPMRFGSVGNPVSTGTPRNGTGQVSVLNDKLVFV